MATAAATPIGDAPSAQLTLPRMGRYKVPEVRFAFGGGVTQRLTSEADVALAKALTLGARGTVTIAIDGHDEPLTLACRVSSESGSFAKLDGNEIVRGTRRLLIGDAAVEDEDDD